MGGTYREGRYVGADMGNILSKRAWILTDAILGDSLFGKGEGNMKYDDCAILDYCGCCKHISATIATLPYCRKLHKHYLRRINRKKNCPHFKKEHKK